MVAFTRKSLVATALFFAFLALWPAPEPDHAGPAMVIDGGTIVIAGETHRLFGIDAVELDRTCTTREGQAWPCGREAAYALRQLLEGRTVGCDVRGRDDDGRQVSICRTGKDDLGAFMAREGWAVADRAAPRLLNYIAEEDMARFLGKGIWSGTLSPRTDRRCQRRWDRGIGQAFVRPRRANTGSRRTACDPSECRPASPISS